MPEGTTNPEAEEHFERIPLADGKSLFRPKVPALIVSNSESKGPNILTAMWWTAAGYRPYKMVVAIAHSTYTYEIMEENQEFVMAAPTRDMMDAIVLCGRRSGREVDKIDRLGLQTLPADKIEVPLLKEAAGNIECKVEDAFEHDGHTYYFAEVVRSYVKPGWFKNGVYSTEGDPMAYLGVYKEGDESYRRHSRLPEERYDFPESQILDEGEM